MSDAQDNSMRDRTSHLPERDEEDPLVTALAATRGNVSADGRALGSISSSASEETRLEEWACGLGLQLDPERFANRPRKGGMEHDVYRESDRAIQERSTNGFSLGFNKITSAAYYRAKDNLGVFDAHDRNLVRAGTTLIPFDVIPCRPAEGFLQFIEDTLASGSSITLVRSTSTS